MKTSFGSVVLLSYLAATGSARPVNRQASNHLQTREVPQEHSHNAILDTVRTSLDSNNPAQIKDPVFGLLGNGAAAAGAGSIKDLDCLQQATADQAFTNAKSAKDVTGMTAALIYRALERNTGAVGLKSNSCTSVTAVNPEIAAIQQHQDPASTNAAAVNKAIALELAKQIAGIGGNATDALQSGTFQPGTIGDPTAKGHTCDVVDDQVGCIISQGLLVDDATVDEINAAVAGVSASNDTAAAAAATGNTSTTMAMNVAAAATSSSVMVVYITSMSTVTSTSTVMSVVTGMPPNAAQGMSTVTVTAPCAPPAPPGAAPTIAPVGSAAVQVQSATTGVVSNLIANSVSMTGSMTNSENTVAALTTSSPCSTSTTTVTVTAAAVTQAASQTAAASSASTESSSSLNFGSCNNPAIIFANGLDGRNQPAFAPANETQFTHGSALGIGVITSFICQQLGVKCKASDAAISACSSGASAAAKVTGQAAADVFNKALGVN